MLLKKFSSLKFPYKFSFKTFKTMSAEEYFQNYSKGTKKIEMHQSKLHPLIQANHDPKHTECYLFGVPLNKIEIEFSILRQKTIRYKPDLIFLQMDPMPYVSRQRFLSHKCALNEVEGYDIKGVDDLSEPKLLSWEEGVVDPLILDMAWANQVHTKLDYTKGFFTYSSKTLQSIKVHDNLTDKFIQAITDYVICDKWSNYHEINQILYTGIMGKQKILLGDMPEMLLRMILGNTLTIEETRDMFKAVLNHIESLEGKLPIKETSLMFFSHIFLAPKDLYMTALLKNVLKACFCVLAFVGSPHVTPIHKYWVPPPEGINFTQATTIPKRILNETDEMLIEKQVIFDVMMESRVWSDKYIINPFPYIEKDIKKFSKEDFEHYKKTFFINLKKYETFKNKIYEKYANNLKITDGRKILSLSDGISDKKRIDSNDNNKKLS